MIDAGGGTGDNSGSYYSGGGGGGGIITVLYEDAHIATQPTACGGRGHQNGGAGFVYLSSTKPGQAYSKVGTQQNSYSISHLLDEVTT